MVIQARAERLSSQAVACITVETRNNEIGGESTNVRYCGNFVGARMRQKRHGIYKKHILFPKVS